METRIKEYNNGMELLEVRLVEKNINESIRGTRASEKVTKEGKEKVSTTRSMTGWIKLIICKESFVRNHVLEVLTKCQNHVQ